MGACLFRRTQEEVLAADRQTAGEMAVGVKEEQLRLKFAHEKALARLELDIGRVQAKAHMIPQAQALAELTPLCREKIRITRLIAHADREIGVAEHFIQTFSADAKSLSGLLLFIGEKKLLDTEKIEKERRSIEETVDQVQEHQDVVTELQTAVHDSSAAIGDPNIDVDAEEMAKALLGCNIFPPPPSVPPSLVRLREKSSDEPSAAAVTLTTPQSSHRQTPRSEEKQRLLLAFETT